VLTFNSYSIQNYCLAIPPHHNKGWVCPYQQSHWHYCLVCMPAGRRGHTDDASCCWTGPH